MGLTTVPLTQPRPIIVGTLLAAAISGVAALLFIRWDDLADLLAPIPQPAAGSQATRRPSRDSE
ncbi:MAG: hypothetical protein ACRDP5_17045 [Streptosporangiaceae bacterium]